MNGAIAAYCRISVDEEIGKSIIAGYTANYFHDCVVDFFEDRDRSGYTFEQRKGYQEMRKGLMSGKYSISIQLKCISTHSFHSII